MAGGAAWQLCNERMCAGTPTVAAAAPSPLVFLPLLSTQVLLNTQYFANVTGNPHEFKYVPGKYAGEFHSGGRQGLACRRCKLSPARSELHLLSLVVPMGDLMKWGCCLDRIFQWQCYY